MSPESGSCQLLLATVGARCWTREVLPATGDPWIPCPVDTLAHAELTPAAVRVIVVQGKRDRRHRGVLLSFPSFVMAFLRLWIVSLV